MKLHVFAFTVAALLIYSAFEIAGLYRFVSALIIHN